MIKKNSKSIERERERGRGIPVIKKLKSWKGLHENRAPNYFQSLKVKGC